MSPHPRAGIPADAVNIHATAIVLGDTGLLISGPPGSGKSDLALALVGRWREAGRNGRFVADDQVFAACRRGRAVAYGPKAIHGFAEARFVGPVRVEAESACILDLVVDLVAAGEPDRIPEERSVIVAGAALPCLVLPARRSGLACRLVELFLDNGGPRPVAGTRDKLPADPFDFGLPSDQGRTT